MFHHAKRPPVYPPPPVPAPAIPAAGSIHIQMRLVRHGVESQQTRYTPDGRVLSTASGCRDFGGDDGPTAVAYLAGLAHLTPLDPAALRDMDAADLALELTATGYTVTLGIYNVADRPLYTATAAGPFTNGPAAGVTLLAQVRDVAAGRTPPAPAKGAGHAG